MKSEYIENFDGIRASEAGKQKAIDTLTNYVNTAKAGGAAKKKKSDLTGI